MEFIKSKEEVLKARLNSITESVFKMGDVYKVKTVIEVPKSLINAFVSKSKKEFEKDPRDVWSDTDLAEMFASYVATTFMNIDSIPLDAIMGEKEETPGAVTTEIGATEQTVATTPAAEQTAATTEVTQEPAPMNTEKPAGEAEVTGEVQNTPEV